MKYAFIEENRFIFRVRPMCRILKVHHSGFYGGNPAVVAPNHLARAFTVEVPDQAWVTDKVEPEVFRCSH